MSSPFRPADLQMFNKIGVEPELLEMSGVVRVSDAEAREEFGFRGSGNLCGIVFQYFDLATMRNGKRRVSARLRRDDFPEGGGKYLCPFGDRRHLYGITPDDGESPIILVEAEKSVLSLTAWSQRVGRKILPRGMGGCWGWRGRISIKEGANGHRAEEKGPLPDLQVCANREVIIALDSNVAATPDVRKAQRALASTLLAMEARVRIALVPAIDGVNGPDDLVKVCGDGALAAVLEQAPLAGELAAADAQAAISAVGRDKKNTTLWREAMDAIAGVPEKLQRKALEADLSAALRGQIPKQTIVDEVGNRRQQQEEDAEATKRQLEEDQLRRVPLDPTALIDDLENYFSARAYLPEGAALLLAFFALHSYLFDVFDTCPYLALESATPRCGKSTVVRLLEFVCAKAVNAVSMNEPVFRLIDQAAPTLLIDEAEGLERHTDRAEALRTIFNEGYKKGAKVPRCTGESHELVFFQVFCPKVMAAIGGITGTLLDRAIVLHMQRAPAGSKLKSSRIRSLKRVAEPLVTQLKAYRIQFRQQVQELYDSEPDAGFWSNLRDREAELWGPLLIHGRVIGQAAEQRLLDVVRRFTESKADIESEDWHIAKAIAVLQVLESLAGDEFTPGDLITALEESEAWAPTFSKVKGDEKGRRKVITAKVGYFLGSFRLKGERRRAGKTYSRQAAIDIVRAHVPENHLHHTQPPQSNHSQQQATENKEPVDGVNGVNGFDGASQKDIFETPDHSPKPGGQPEPCYLHGHDTTWWQRPDGGWQCERCHPDPQGSDENDAVTRDKWPEFRPEPK